MLALLPVVIKSACELEGASEALTQNQTAKLWPNQTREASSAHSAAATVVLHSLGKRKKLNAGVSIGRVRRLFCFSNF